MPKLEESLKEILFAYWDSQLRKVEKEIAVVPAIANNVIENINENLHSANSVAEFVPGFLPNVKKLEQHWREAT